MTSRIVATRSALSSLAGGSLLRVGGGGETKPRRQDLRRDSRGAKTEFAFDPLSYDIHLAAGTEQLVRYTYQRCGHKDVSFPEVELMHPEAVGIAVKKAYMDKGAERAAFRMTEVDRRLQPVGRAMVAKVSICEEPDQLAFHQGCGRTQLEARRLAIKFNTTLAEHEVDVPKVEFLEPCFYAWYGATMTSAVLAEKQLDSDNYKKWNDNKGGVDTLLVPRGADIVFPTALAACEEGDEEQESEGDEEAGEDKADAEEKVARQMESIVPDESVRTNIIDDDVPQAFSHWTYQYTHGDLLVCDLQGVQGASSFQMTDPAIHSRRARVRFGQTDHSARGQRAFFATHRCNALCRFLNLRTPTFKPE
jgi:hypothetical protein